MTTVCHRGQYDDDDHVYRRGCNLRRHGDNQEYRMIMPIPSGYDRQTQWPFPHRYLEPNKVCAASGRSHRRAELRQGFDTKLYWVMHPA